MIKKPIPTACEILMNSFLSGSVGCVSDATKFGCGRRTGAAVHEQSTLLEELSGHTARMLAISYPVFRASICLLGKLLDVLHGGGCVVASGG
jgi:hypothetical protein